ncbi:zeta toxin family protein [Streptomyces sp. H27-S2]|uniref:zeta toxin family protein n=1 Tax=Streptomyces antarcticus TaxID=2996458 RepID=UPI00226DAAE1|nr:zeta toxin family protein [Streptomyces sp. H27-S2]MCY0954122.1 zeta toxin family protein [Streptomyces sp. H27-S2]
MEDVVAPLGERQFLDEQLTAWTRAGVRQESPVVVFVAGPPGSGKTRLGDLVQAALDHRGGAVRIGSDLYKDAHHEYQRFLAQDVRTAGVQVRADTRRWQAEVEARARAGRMDAVVETAMSDLAEFRSVASSYREAGYRIEVAALATPEAVDQLGILSRFLDGAVEGRGRYVSWANHDACAQGLLSTLAVAEAEHLADRIVIVRRDQVVLYDNHLVGGAWHRRPAAERAVAYERARPWSAQDTAVFRRELALTDQRLHREPLDGDRRLAVQRDSERAAALSEPVRRIAQATARAPGVDYHRLSVDEHQWIFDELIAPSILGGVTARRDPQAVFVVGQPGAGKSGVSRMVRRAMRPGTTHVVGDDFKVAHPDYLRLLTDDPRHAGAAIRADYRAWMGQAEAHLRTRRGDVLIEAAPGDTREFMSSVLPFHQAGYAVEVVVVAVRAADSRLATALRYARAQQLGIPARFTSARGHGVCFEAVGDVVALAEAHPAVAAVTVIGRDGTALLRSETDGQRGRAVWALAAERSRAYTREEAVRFLSLHRALRRALPRYRHELDEIAALARPMMPTGMRPARLSHPRPGVQMLCLPVRRGGDYWPFSSWSRAA